MFTFEMFFKAFRKYGEIVNGYTADSYETVSNVRYPRNPSFVVFSDNSGHFAEWRYNRIENKNESVEFGHFRNWEEAYNQITERMPTARIEVAQENAF